MSIISKIKTMLNKTLIEVKFDKTITIKRLAKILLIILTIISIVLVLSTEMSALTIPYIMTLTALVIITLVVTKQ